MNEPRVTLKANVSEYLEGMNRAEFHARAYRAVKWEKWRRFLRRHGIRVPAFMLP